MKAAHSRPDWGQDYLRFTAGAAGEIIMCWIFQSNIEMFRRGETRLPRCANIWPGFGLQYPVIFVVVILSHHSWYCTSTHRFSDVTAVESDGFPKQSIVECFSSLKLSSAATFRGWFFFLTLNVISHTLSPQNVYLGQGAASPSYPFLICSNHSLNNAINKCK